MMENTPIIFQYHEATKHHFNRYARSAGHMDWRNQPDPFRSYAGAKRFRLPLLKEDPVDGHMALYQRADSAVRLDDAALPGAFFELSMGLSAWKAAGESRWALRMNPSSGNLHPTEAHLVWPGSAGLPPGVYHYHPLDHALELRMALSESLGSALRETFSAGAFLVGVSSIFWRESWKYGERAFRYCLLDAGHALAAMRFSASLTGFCMTALSDLSDAEIAAVLGFDRTRWPELGDEHPELLCAVHPAGVAVPRGLSREMIAMFAKTPVTGTPGPLSRSPVRWEAIDAAAAATVKPRTSDAVGLLADRPFIASPPSAFPAAAIVRKRRSATAYHAGKGIDREVFAGILDKTLPRPGFAPFDLGAALPPSVDLFLFVHQVKGLDSGLYYLLRTADDPARMRRLTSPDFRWTPIGAPLPLFLLKPGDVRETARTVSCHQDIAGDGAFSVGMIARFRPEAAAEPYRYRRLFWEGGMIGQVLYLEAEAAGIRGTGIGCFFDDPVHALLGLADDRYQSIYHFTMGAPVEDRRMETLPPYSHLKDLWVEPPSAGAQSRRGHT